LSGGKNHAADIDVFLRIGPKVEQPAAQLRGILLQQAARGEGGQQGIMMRADFIGEKVKAHRLQGDIRRAQTVQQRQGAFAVGIGAILHQQRENIRHIVPCGVLRIGVQLQRLQRARHVVFQNGIGRFDMQGAVEGFFLRADIMPALAVFAQNALVHFQRGLHGQGLRIRRIIGETDARAAQKGFERVAFFAQHMLRHAGLFFRPCRAVRAQQFNHVAVFAVDRDIQMKPVGFEGDPVPEGLIEQRPRGGNILPHHRAGQRIAQFIGGGLALRHIDEHTCAFGPHRKLPHFVLSGLAAGGVNLRNVTITNRSPRVKYLMAD